VILVYRSDSRELGPAGFLPAVMGPALRGLQLPGKNLPAPCAGAHKRRRDLVSSSKQEFPHAPNSCPPSASRYRRFAVSEPRPTSTSSPFEPKQTREEMVEISSLFLVLLFAFCVLYLGYGGNGEVKEQRVDYHAPSRPALTTTSATTSTTKKLATTTSATTSTTKKLANFLATPLQDIAIEDVPGVGPVTKERLAKHAYVSITRAEQLFGMSLYLGRGEQFKAWLKTECEVTGAVAKQLHEACLNKAEKVCIQRGGGGSAGGAVGRAETTTQVWNRTPIQDVKIRDVPGVGDITAKNMGRTKNITTGEQLFGFFLYLGRDENRFKSWLKDECDVQGSVAARTCGALAERANDICSL